MNTQTPINTRAAWRPVLRPIGKLVIAAQLALALQPLSAIAQDKGATPYNPQAQAQLQRLGELNQRMEQAKAQKAKAARSPADQASEKLARTEELVKGIRQDKDSRDARRAERRSQRLNELKEQLQGVEAGIADVRTEFEATGAELKRKNLPAEIIQRHQQAQAEFEQRAADYKKIAARLNKQQPDETAIEELDTFFKKHPASRKPAERDAKKLPWRTPSPNKRAPAETKAAWHRQLYADQHIQLAQAGGLTTIGGIRFTYPPEPGQAPTDADLAETGETRLTPAIRAKAAELNHNPVAIHNWVRNTIDYVPTAGAIQSAQDTLDKRRGNATDTASLLIALLRASGIPARYQWGTIDVPAEQAMNWTGGVSHAEAALQLLNQGGIAARGIASAGRIRSIRMEHVWVSAYVNWTPSRGAKDGGWDLTPKQHPNPNASLNAWAPLDASYKQYTYNAGMDLSGNVPLDANALLAAARQGATVNEAEGWVQNLNQAAIQSQMADYQARLKTYIDSTPTGTSSTVGDVIGKKLIPQRNWSLLAGTLAHPVVQLGAQASAVPTALQHKFKYELTANGAPLLTYTEKTSNLT
ncbi:MAG: transglutaminase domain-containing protein, partial [Ramlibacter sp.]